MTDGSLMRPNVSFPNLCLETRQAGDGPKTARLLLAEPSVGFEPDDAPRMTQSLRGRANLRDKEARGVRFYVLHQHR